MQFLRGFPYTLGPTFKIQFEILSLFPLKLKTFENNTKRKSWLTFNLYWQKNQTEILPAGLLPNFKKV